jgi:hypothetical protein
MMACLAGVTLWMYLNVKTMRAAWFLVFLLYTAATISTLARVSWVLLFVLVFCMIAFRSKLVTGLVYAGLVGVFFMLAFWGREFLELLQGFVSTLPLESAHARRAFTVGTLYDRVIGLEQWVGNTEAWSWWGKEAGTHRTHDALGQTLEQYGAVVLFTILAVGTAFLYYCHSSLFKIKDTMDRHLATLYLAVVFAILSTGIVNGGHTSVFPVNLFFWTIMGFLTKFFVLADRAQKEPERTPTTSRTLVLRPTSLSPSSVYYSR